MKNTTQSSLAQNLACLESLNLYINAEVICSKQSPLFIYLFILERLSFEFSFWLLRSSVFSKRQVLIREQGRNQFMF